MVISFYKYNSYFLSLPAEKSNIATVHAESAVRNAVVFARVFAPNALSQELRRASLVEERELVAIEDPPLLLVGSANEFVSRAITGNKLNEDRLKLAGRRQFSDWKATLDRQVIDILLHETQSLHDPSAFCARYSHSDAYSLWIFNPHTSVLTCAASTYKYEKTFLTRKESSSLFAFLDSKNPYESRTPDSRLCPHPDLSECKTLNRIRIELGHSNTVAILNLYSKNAKFTIPADIADTVSGIIAAKYGESRFDLHKDYEQIEHFFTTDYSLGKLNDFLRELTGQIATHVHDQCRGRWVPINLG